MDGFDAIALMEPVRRILSTGGGADAVYGLQASSEFLRVLGAPPRAGRTFRAGEDVAEAGEAVVMVTEEAWRRRWAESPGLVGTTLLLDGETHTVVGILPAGLFPRGILSPFPVEFVVPIRARREAAGPFSRSEHWASVYGRLARGMRVEDADARLKDQRLRSAPAYPAYKQAWGVKVMPLVDRVARPSRSVVGILLAAVTVVLLGATGMLLRSLSQAVQVDPGFDPSHAIAFEVTLPETAYPDDRARHALSVRLRERIRALPSVQAVGAAMGIPFRGGAFGERVGVIGRPRGDQDPIVRVNYVSPGFHESLGMRLLAGRVLNEADDRTDADRVLLVNRTAANHFFGAESPLDRQLTMLGKTWRVVGVVADVVGSRVEEAASLCVHVPHCHNTSRFSMVVRVRGEWNAVAGALLGVARDVDSRLAISDVRSLSDARHSSFTPRRLMLGLIAGFGVTAAGMAALGLYGVLACSVAQRRRELAIRLAMGSGRRGVVGLVLREALGMCLVGGFSGWGLSLVAHRLLSSQLYGVPMADPWVLAGTGLSVVAMAAVSAWLPARRASSVEPVELLRSE